MQIPELIFSLIYYSEFEIGNKFYMTNSGPEINIFTSLNLDYFNLNFNIFGDFLFNNSKIYFYNKPADPILKKLLFGYIFIIYLYSDNNNICKKYNTIKKLNPDQNKIIIY